MFDEEKCIRCGTCLESCPVIDLDSNQAQEEIENLIAGSSFVVDKCAVCGTCNFNCPENLTPMDLIKELKYKKMRALKEQGRLPKMIEFILPFNKPNVFSLYEQTLMSPEEIKNLRKWENPQKSDELVLLGCAISYILQGFYKNPTIEGILKGKAVAGGLEFCCGELYHRMCYPISKEMIEEQLLAKFSELGTDKLIIFCSECNEAFRSEYKKISRDFKLMHIYEVICNAIEAGEVPITNPLDGLKITYADPCAVKKHPKMMEYPRKIIETTGAELIELEHNRENSLCCGLALGLNGLGPMEKTRKKKLKEVKNTGTEYLIYTCPGCMINFALDRNVQRGRIKILSVMELLRMSCGEKIDFNKSPTLINGLINKALSMLGTF